MSDTPSNLERLKALFVDAIELAPDERAQLVARVRAEDQALGAELLRMLGAHDQASEGAGFLVDPTLDPASPRVAGRTIGPFKLLKLIGEGGFGEVYLAEQASPIRRNVALKIIRPGMDGGQFLDRFDAERQALAIMDHPNIARVFDAGTDERGRPFFAMEYVDGEPIHTFADRHRMDVRARIGLMIPVCRAVHHAHQKGVIHRDLKPGNVLVSLIDGRAVPKVIDFGVAKALDRPLTDKTIFTELRSLIGTPEYMSPEQADLDGGRDIDTRSDVYSLGVLLYELLVGATPFDGKELRSRAFGEMQRILREVDPPTPSTRFSRLETRASAAANRGIEPAKLSSSLRGELDWITMKCLEKDRARRYDSPADLAEELERFLEARPVKAGPVSRAYRLRKYAKRHRIGVIAAGLITAALLAGIAGIVWGSIQARRERDEALASRHQADQARLATESARRSEAEARAIAQENSRFLREMFESIDPSAALGRVVSVREVLDAATARIDAAPPSSPAVEASLRGTFGRAYSGLGLLEPARRQLERARQLGDDSPETTRALIGVMSSQAEYEPALALARRAIEEETDAHGMTSADALKMRNAEADVLVLQGKRDAAERALNHILTAARAVSATQPSANEAIVEAISSLSDLMISDGRFAEAETLLLEALQRTPGEARSPAIIGLQATLGDLYRNTGRFNEAIPMLTEARANAIRVLGPEHTTTLTVANNLALAQMTVGKLKEAETLYDEVIRLRTRILGEDHPRTLLARGNRALVYQQQARYDEAEKEFLDIADRYHRALGPDHQDTIIADNNLASLYVRQNRLDEAETIFRRLLDRVRATQGEKTLAFASLSVRLGSLLCVKQDYAAAEPLLAQAFASAQAMGIADVQAGFALGYGICLAELGKAQEALVMLARADAAYARQPNADPSGQQRLAKAMARAHQQLGHVEEAQQWETKAQEPTSAPAR